MTYYNGKWHRYSEAERREYGRLQQELRNQEWHKTWISKTGLKQCRNWTDAMFKSLLEGKEQDAGKIKAYKRTLIASVDKTKKFQVAMAERVAKQQKKQKV